MLQAQTLSEPLLVRPDHFRCVLHSIGGRDSQDAQKEDTNQLYLPPPLYVEIPYQGQWQDDRGEIRGHIEYPKNCRR